MHYPTIEAYKQGMTGEKYVWMMLGYYSHAWYMSEEYIAADSHLNCTADELKKAVEESIFIATESIFVSTSEGAVVSGKVMQWRI